MLWEIILEWSGPLCFLSMQLSLLHTSVYQIAMTGNEKKISSIPFLALLTNSSLWAMYGLLSNETPVFVPNAIGTTVGLVCVLLYHFYSLERTPTLYYIISASIITFCFGCGYFGHHEIIGSFGVCAAVFLMGSPLSTLSEVIATKSTKTMPSFTTSLTTWLNCFSWSLYGIILAHDFNVYIPNLLGLILASIQIFLYAIYGFETIESNDDDSDIELNGHTVSNRIVDNSYLKVATTPNDTEGQAIRTSFPKYN
mmetsp:Transcript_27017/g.37249  ORF Transcript_27017/g.37249 Transcript_27017/m.37249 type:complete len:254 (+) Transcript_27017:3-764(+)